MQVPWANFPHLHWATYLQLYLQPNHQHSLSVRTSCSSSHLFCMWSFPDSQKWSGDNAYTGRLRLEQLAIHNISSPIIKLAGCQLEHAWCVRCRVWNHVVYYGWQARQAAGIVSSPDPPRHAHFGKLDSPIFRNGRGAEGLGTRLLRASMSKANC